MDPDAEDAGAGHTAEDAGAGHGAGPGTPPPPPPPGGFPPPPPGGFPPPPPGGFPPPPPGGAFGPSQPTGGAFAARYGLIRPQHGRWFAGVAAAIGRATNTDPVLWRVLFGVLTLFGGVGLLVYLLGWLLIPAEGDTGSPAEALIGRGRSSTSTPVALLLAALTVVMAGVALSGSLRSALLGAAVILGAAALVSRGRLPASRPSDAPPPPAAGWSPPWSTPAGSDRPTQPDAPTPPNAPAPPHPPTTGEPFAPHGPYASFSPYAQSLGYAPPPPPMYPGLAPARPPVPKPPRERSRLGRLVLSLMCLVLGALAVYDVAGHVVPASAYLAATLGVIGFGLVVGAWVGRARWLIFPGLVLLAALTTVSAAARVAPWHGAPWHFTRAATDHDRMWQPMNVNELDSNYTIGVGNGTLDLSHVDFRDHTVSLDAHVDVGNLVVILPPDVDVDVTATVDGGSADILGQHWGGFGKDTHQTHDNGRDGPGGGTLQLNTTVNLGKLEVRR
ncbi:PspC domain-containing protein [Planosporangium thailandense]|uniref:PspC domain-containing protein n=1 Tax=Planosporangium thailandense TaxID=765197 RepID=A0ABX0XY89_9ACTN|nr:PspC domain-containing protein [Planosporangium thailandense]